MSDDENDRPLIRAEWRISRDRHVPQLPESYAAEGAYASPDYATRAEARQAAQQYCVSLDASLKRLKEALFFKEGGNKRSPLEDVWNSYFEQPVSLEPASSIMVFAQMGGAIAASTGLTMGGIPGLSCVPVLQMIHGKLSQLAGPDVQRDLKRDFMGKQEASFVYSLGLAHELRVPVTPHNVQVMIGAVDAAADYVLAARKSGKVEGIEEGLERAMLAHVARTAHGAMVEQIWADPPQVRPFTLDDISRTVPVSAGQEVDGEPHSGLPAVARPANEAGRAKQ